MSLSDMFMHEKIQAARTGTDRPLNLSGGARLVVRSLDGVVTLTIARGKGKKLGDREIITFKEQCGVPENAARFPAEGQGQKGDSWYVAYRWKEEGVDQ
jgi:hypothetical protein